LSDSEVTLCIPKYEVMKTRLRFLVMLVLVGFNTMYGQFSADRPDLRLCGSPPNYYLDYYNCTSNNYTLVDVFLSLTDVNGVPLNNTTCTIGTPQNLYVMLNYTSNSASAVHHSRMFADLNIEGQGTVPLNVDFRTVQPGAGQIALYGPFTWVCGQEITLSRILIVWRTNGDDTELVPYDCSSYNKSQCDLPDNIAVTAPLAVEFNYTACTVGSSTTVNFNSTTSGGTPPYTFAWDFDNNGTTDSILENPTFVYNNGMSYSAELTVTDNLGLSNSYLVPIVYPTEIQITSSIATVGCSSSNDGAIDITVTGGTPPYSYLWSNSATTQNLTNLTPGSYNVQVTDAFGCIKNESFTILNGDTTPPIVTITPDVTLEGCSTAIIDVTDLPYSVVSTTIDLTTFQSVGGTVTDASSISSISYQDTQTGTCPIVVTRTFTVLDACNNSASISKIFTIDDTTPPTFVEALPTNITVECNAVPTAVTLTATDVCGTPTVTYVEVRTNGTCINDYTLTRTWTATDACGNVTTHNQIITVQDNSNPTFVESLPANVTVECNAVPTAVTLTATDVCGTPTVTYVEVRTNGTCTNEYTLTRTWTATDECGNVTTHIQTITVQDNSNPTFVESLPADITVECNTVPTAVTLTATDFCGTATVTFAEVRTNGACTYDFTLTRTWTATDACGNVTTHSQIITVQDTSNPAFVESLPANVTVECNAVPNAVTLTARDVCGTPTVTYVEVRTNGTCINDYTLTRTWTATDACGNTTIHNQIITVQDTSNPVYLQTKLDFC
jgi:ribosomal protein S26